MHLTDTEKIVIALVVNNTRPVVIAGVLGVSARSVGYHLNNIYKKFRILRNERSGKTTALRAMAMVNKDLQLAALEGQRLLVARNYIKEKRAAIQSPPELQ